MKIIWLIHLKMLSIFPGFWTQIAKRLFHFTHAFPTPLSLSLYIDIYIMIGK